MAAGKRCLYGYRGTENRKGCEDWYNANARVGGEPSPELQQVRNTLGPSWLNRTTLRQIRESA